MLRDFTKGNGTYHLRFVFKGSVENLTANRLSIVTVGDRINSATGAKCEISNPCPPNFYCIEGICADLSKTPAKQVINLSECLKRVNPTNLTLDAPSSVGEGANFTVTAALSADNLALAGEGIWLYCMGSVINGTTDSAGRVSYHLMAGSGGSTCTATFQGASSYGPSKDSRYVGVNMPLPVCEPWMVVFFGVMVLLAVFFSVAEGRFKLFDVYQKLRELVR
jgi:hypothetical protein